MMVWVQRDMAGAICGIYANRQDDYAEEELFDDDSAVIAFLNPPIVQTILSQDIMAQFTVSDFTAIKTAINGNDQFGLFWAQLQAQKDPMHVPNARFLAGWSAFVQVLGQPRMSEIATALNVTIG